MIVNNWYVVVQQFVDVLNGNTLYRIYFIIFYYFGVVIGLNIVVAFAIDMYAAVRRLEQQRIVNQKYLVALSQERKKDDEIEIESDTTEEVKQVLIDRS